MNISVARLVMGFLVMVGCSTAAHAQSPRGVETSVDEQQIIVSKDIGSERWAIVLDAQRATVVGNVFDSSGGTPKFVWCALTGVQSAPDPRNSQYTLRCFGSSPCAGAPCGGNRWTPLGETSIAGSFFLP